MGTKHRTQAPFSGFNGHISKDAVPSPTFHTSVTCIDPCPIQQVQVTLNRKSWYTLQGIVSKVKGKYASGDVTDCRHYEDILSLYIDD